MDKAEAEADSNRNNENKFEEIKFNIYSKMKIKI